MAAWRFTLGNWLGHGRGQLLGDQGAGQEGAVLEEDTPRDTPYLPLDPDRPGKALTEDQAGGGGADPARAWRRRYGTTLLKGVTGSGKTEVYLEAVAECLRAGAAGAGAAARDRADGRIPDAGRGAVRREPAEWHSGVTMTERRRCWRMVGQGAAQVVVGARSALFLPFRDLGLIVVDEEHDTSYKQEDGALQRPRHGGAARLAE